jgi:uncharacterized protein YqhQ
MKIFLLLITLLLFILRVYGTPRMISKKAFFKKLNESLKKNDENFKDRTDKEVKITKHFALTVVGLLQFMLAIFYMAIGARINITYFTILTLIQILTVIYTSITQLNMNAFSQDMKHHKFHRWYFLFNVILDYIYYPLAFYLLIK